MEGRKESKYNLAGTCSECGKLIKVEHIICVDIVEPGTSTKVEEKDNDTGSNNQTSGTAQAESADVRPDSAKGNPAAANRPGKPDDSEKSTGNKKAGGKTK